MDGGESSEVGGDGYESVGEMAAAFEGAVILTERLGIE